MENIDKETIREREMREKAKAFEAKSQTMRGDCGYLIPSRPSLRERVENSKYKSSRAAEQRARMQELADLLDKNPDVARILDLVSSLED